MNTKNPSVQKANNTKLSSCRNQRVRKPAESRRNEIIAAARILYEQKGLSKTSIQDIANYVGVARSLFYHYFSDKTELTSAVLDACIAEYIEALKDWNEHRTIGDIESGLESFIECYRTSISGTHPFLKTFSTRENAALYFEFLDRISTEAATYICETTVVDYEAFHSMEIKHVYETFYLLIFGLIGYLRHHPETSDECIKDLIAQTLHMERGTNTVPAYLLEALPNKHAYPSN